MDPIAATGPDALNAGTSIWSFLIENGALIGFFIFSVLEFFSSSGNKAIAAVNEIRKGDDIPPETAKRMAVKLFKKYLPFIPDIIAAAFVQFLFDRMKKTTT